MSASDCTVERVAACFERGVQLMHERSYDYAHVVLVECVMYEPGNLAFVEAMLKNLRLKAAPSAEKTCARAGRESFIAKGAPVPCVVERFSFGL